MKCTKAILGGLIAGVAMVNAMPTLEQTKKVEPLVMGLMREDENALKSGKKTRTEVAQSAMELANKAESEAAKLLLMKGALNLYVRAGAFDKAIETLHSLKAAIPDIPQPIVTNMIETALRGAAKKEDGELFHKLKSIHVPVNAKSWAGMKKWQGIPIAFDGKAQSNTSRMFLPTLNRRRPLIEHASEWTDPATGYKWSYTVNGDTANIFKRGGNLYASVAVSPEPKGNLTIPSHLGGKTVTSIGYSAFDGCNGLTSVTIPCGVTELGQRAFFGCGGLKSFVVDPNNTSYKSVNGLLLSKDGTRLIYGINGDVTIPNGVTSIADGAFNDRSGLINVTIPNSVTNIEHGTFFGCNGLKSFVVDPKNTSYKSVNGLLLSKDGTQLICSVNGAVTIPNGVTCIEEYAFSVCNSLTSVTIPNSVTNIDEVAFLDCGGLKSLVVAPDNTSYKSVKGLLLSKDGTRLICGNNGDVTIPNGVVNIGNFAFDGCSSLTSVTMPNSVVNIGNFAFACCSSLTSVTMPNSVTNIGEQAFIGCSGLKSVTIPNSVANIGPSAFNGCSGLTSVTIPNSVADIEYGAFEGCSSLTNVTMPNSVKSIGNDAFRNCSNLTSVTIPNSVTNILLMVFDGCNELTSVTMSGERPNAFRETFKGCRKLKSIHVPANAKSWAGLKDWQGIPLVFEGDDVIRQREQDAQQAMKSERQTLEKEKAEREAQRRQFQRLQDELRKAREKRAAEQQMQAESAGRNRPSLGTLRSIRQARDDDEKAKRGGPLRRPGMLRLSGRRIAHEVEQQAAKEAGASGIQMEKFPLAQGIDLEMIKCPAGEFMMGYESWNTWGSALNREPRKLHRVKLTKDFMLGKFPVTCSQWYAIMENGKKAPNGMEDTPVGNITVLEMQAFCDRLTKKFKAQLGGKVFRLPTDAEWEYASKGGKNLDGMLGKTTGWNGNTGSSSRDTKEVEAIFLQMGYTGEDHARVSDIKKPYFMWKTLPVGKHKPNEWGFMDLIGNAWEVTADKIMDFKEASEFHKDVRRWNGHQRYSDFEIDPLLKDERHLIRTGFWDKGAATSLGHKNSIGDNDRFPAVGFRVCIGEPLGDWNNAKTTTPLPR